MHHGAMVRHRRGLLSDTVEGGGGIVIGVIDGVECILNLDGSCKEVIGPTPSPPPNNPPPPQQPPAPAPQPNNPIPVTPITLPPSSPPSNSSPQPNPPANAPPPSNDDPAPAPSPNQGFDPGSPVAAPGNNGSGSAPPNANSGGGQGVTSPGSAVGGVPAGSGNSAGQGVVDGQAGTGGQVGSGGQPVGGGTAGSGGQPVGSGQAGGAGQGGSGDQAGSAGQAGNVGQAGSAAGSGSSSGTGSTGAGQRGVGAGQGGAANQAQLPIGVATDVRTLTGDALTSFFSSLSSVAAAAGSLTPTSVLGAPLTTTDAAGRTIVVTPTTVGIGPLGPLVIFTTTGTDGTAQTVTIASPTPLPPVFRPTQTSSGPNGGDGHLGDSDDASGLSTGAIIGIVLACLAAGAACLCLGIFGRRRRQRKGAPAPIKPGHVMASQLGSTPTSQDMPFFGSDFNPGPGSPDLITTIPSSFIHFRNSEDIDEPAISPRESLATIRRPEMREAASVRSMTASVHTSGSGTMREVRGSEESGFKTSADAPPVPASPGRLLSRLSSRRKPPPPVTAAPFEDLLELPKPSPRANPLRHSSDSEDPFRRSIPVMAPHLVGRGAMLSPTPEPSSVGDPFEDEQPRASISSSITAMTDSSGELDESTLIMGGMPMADTTPSSREDLFTDAPSHQTSSDEDARDSISVYSERELSAFPTARTFGEPTSPYRSHFAEQLLQQRDSIASSAHSDDQRLRPDDLSYRPALQAESAADPYAYAPRS